MDDYTRLNPFSSEVICNQATINIGTIGHVAHGKTTVVRAISGVHTIRHKNELIRNITIKLGYANAKIFECPKCPRPLRYSSSNSEIAEDVICKFCDASCKLVRHVSFVDCPGHDILMATMLNGAAVMDAALLLIAGNETCPQPQTKEHLAAIDIMQLNHIAILQNKIDLVKKEQAKEQHSHILKFINGTSAQRAPVIPISAQLKYNINYVLDFIVNKIPMPLRDFSTSPKMIIIRSFDVNKPGCEVDELTGGVAGGSILQGILRLGQKIEIRPGIISRVSENQFTCTPIISTIVSLKAEENELKFAIPGGLIGVGTNIDPQLCRADRLVGQVLGAVGQLPSILKNLEIEFSLLRRLLGVRVLENKRGARVVPLQSGENLMINVGSLSSNCKVEAVKDEVARISLQNPVCTEVGEKIAISRKIDKHWRLIGWGKIRKGTCIRPQPSKDV